MFKTLLRRWRLMQPRPLGSQQYASKGHPGFPQPPDPQLCCGTGCHNCVWIQYADSILNYVHTHHASATKEWEHLRKILDENVEDVNLKAYLEMEVKTKMGV